MLPHGHKKLERYIPMPTDPTAANEQIVQITPHIRVLYGATVETDGETWTGWAVWDDYEEVCAVYRTREQAVQFAKQHAMEYENGER
jgi:hypothetical protein